MFVALIYRFFFRLLLTCSGLSIPFDWLQWLGMLTLFIHNRLCANKKKVRWSSFRYNCVGSPCFNLMLSGWRKHHFTWGWKLWSKRSLICFSVNANWFLLFDQKCIINIYFLGRDNSLLRSKNYNQPQKKYIYSTKLQVSHTKATGSAAGRLLLYSYPVSIYIDKTWIRLSLPCKQYQ